MKMSGGTGHASNPVSVTNRPFPKPVQNKAVALISGNSDVLIEVENGRGVEVFGPVLVRMISEMLKGVPKQRKDAVRIPRAAIIEPTSNSATRTFEKIQQYAKQANNPNIRMALAADGMSMETIRTSWANGSDIVVGTPVNLQHKQKAGFLNLAKCKIFVVNDGYYTFSGARAEVTEWLQRKIPRQRNGRKRQTIVCSSIVDVKEIQEFAKKNMRSPSLLNLRGNEVLPATAFHTVVKINPSKDSSWKKMDRQIITDGVHPHDNSSPEEEDTLSEAVKILRVEYIVRAIDVHSMDLAVIICRTRLDCDNLEKHLKNLNKEKYSCACYPALKADKPSEEVNLTSINDKNVKILICTEEEFRQVRVTALPFLINASFPSDKYDYLKRAQKFGNVERFGLVINLVAAVREKVWNDRKLPNEEREDSWHGEPSESTLWRNELEGLLHVENQFNTKFFEIQPDMKVTSDEFNKKRFNGNEGQQPGGRRGPGGKRFPSRTSGGGANKRFRQNDSVSISIPSDKEPITGKIPVATSFRATISHPDYPAFELTNEQLVTLQRSIMKAVELVPDDGPQVRFQECVQKSGWLLIVCADQVSYSWLQNTVKGLEPWDGAQLRVVLEKDLIPETYVFEAFIPDDVGIRATSEQVLTRLRKMNRTLETDKWTILHQEESDGGQKWTFKVDLASLKALESMDCRPYFGFGQVQFVRKLNFEVPKPEESPSIAGTAVTEPVKGATSVAEAMEEGAVEPKESDNSASEPLQGETSVVESMEDRIPEEENTRVTESIEDQSSANQPLDSGMSATENSAAVS